MNMQTSLKERPKILVFCRNYLVEHFHLSTDPLSDKFDFRYLTDGVCKGTDDTRKPFYTALNQNRKCDEISPDEERDIIDRCRMLRNINPITASTLVHAMACTLLEKIDNLKPRAILTQMVDEYVTHILHILSLKRDIGYVGFCAGYFPGTSLLLADASGRPFEWREAPLLEVEQILVSISGKKFRQNYLMREDYGFAQHLVNMLRYQTKRFVFSIKKIVEKDPWNIHYAVTPFVAEKRHIGAYPFESYFHIEWKLRLNSLKKANAHAKIIYLPLSYFPESTIDYWVRDKVFTEYERTIDEILKKLGGDFILVVKEHLHMRGSRSAGFLKKLRDLPNIVSVLPSELSNEVLDECDSVVMGSGSPGIEATIRGKPVFSFCDTSYWFKHSGAPFLDIKSLGTWPTLLREHIGAFEANNPSDNISFIANCLRSSTRIKPESSLWPILNSEDLNQVISRAIETDSISVDIPTTA